MPHLARPTDAHVAALMQWFPDAQATWVWSPSNRFPFGDRASFRADSKLDELPSFMLVDVNDTPLGFGQFYERLGCCHLARLVIAPERRGQGLGSVLIEQLCNMGTATLGTRRCSLFVMDVNATARRLYERMGFVETAYPEAMPLAGCAYMTRD